MIAFTVNGVPVGIEGNPGRRLAEVLREDLRLTGTKTGCDAGDCGACTVLIDGAQACACLVPVGQVARCTVRTVEGLAKNGALDALQRAFLRHGAVQCGICTPGMLMAATDLLSRIPHPTEAEAMDAIGGVLCRCTGYRSILTAVLDAAGETAPSDGAVGARTIRRDGAARVTGATQFGADARAPEPALTLRAIRSPHPHARFTLGDTDALPARHPGLVRVLTARDIPGRNVFGIYPTGKDQPVLADGYVRHRGEPVCALVGEPDAIAAITEADLGLTWQVLEPVAFDAALAGRAPQLHAHAEANVLCRGRVATGDSARPAPKSVSRPASSSTPTSNPKPALPGASATASRSPPAPRPPTWTATRSPASSASRSSRCA
jgi:aerobic-type carbon monoxide dehydrogenase small subunit (CoxS/CutS family)